MYGIFTYIYHENQLNVGKYNIHGWYGIWNLGPEQRRSTIHHILTLGHPGLDVQDGRFGSIACVTWGFRAPCQSHGRLNSHEFHWDHFTPHLLELCNCIYNFYNPAYNGFSGAHFVLSISHGRQTIY